MSPTSINHQATLLYVGYKSESFDFQCAKDQNPDHRFMTQILSAAAISWMHILIPGTVDPRSPPREIQAPNAQINLEKS
jgi:hypothetical protein